MKNSKKTSALTEKNGVEQPESISDSVAKNLVSKRQQQVSANELVSGIFAQNITSLSRAITLVESTNPEHQKKAAEVVSACITKANNSVRIGITGVPGVGKSTFIEAFGKYLTGIGKKVAVLAVDPSSSLSHGSILGDKTRMEELVKDENAYIRPSASGETLGGVARKTRETITLCEAFGFDTIIIETVGVGQSETAVHGMTDFFLLLQISGAGDELQGIKRGIMEMADAIVISKADGDNVNKARLAKTEFGRALHFFPEKVSGWMPKATTCSAITKEGIPEVWEIISAYLNLTKENGFFAKRRSEQNLDWMFEAVNEQLKMRFYSDPDIAALVETLSVDLLGNRISSFGAAGVLLERYFTKNS
ncbi:methylmalonyl Co-A mutase-associated GTPase MeaB [Flavobacterium sp.]|uniref:methylmalonyl Co-A mutase-associated GTPase MeaB n=1 Tax=Flavobacterium sp. TaxID=239 RepID=UPI001224B3EB|nr:methylmalonyl Co-A mutase-associated GTPase MeaB [Flavobacterium sp.]RZJ71281.1 MAG: methylmalonyl Co-A mutase-associated GTPase MeaB [Flavobacterium sp.]